MSQHDCHEGNEIDKRFGFAVHVVGTGDLKTRTNFSPKT